MLSPDILAIWRLGPDVLQQLRELPSSALAALFRILSMEEQRRADAFHAEEHRRAYIAAHAALRLVLSRLTGAPPQSLQLIGENGSKPTLASAFNPGDLRFNLSHTQNAILIAATAGREIGVDVEWHRPIDDLEAMAQAVMSSVELATWNQLVAGPRIDAFYHLWTRKEAYLKAIGLGLFRDLHAITVPAVAEILTLPVTVEDMTDVAVHSPWRLCDLSVWPDFSAAICWQGPDHPRLEIHELALHDLSGPTSA